MTGSLPLLTKGSIAKFLGGEGLFEDLTDEKPSNTILYFFVASIVFQIIIWSYKKYRTYKNIKLHTYMDDLRKSLGEISIIK